MPYFVYRISPEKELTLLDVHEKYPDAKSHARGLRIENEGDGNTYRLVFAKDKQEARRLLSTARDMASPLEEWEEKT